MSFWVYKIVEIKTGKLYIGCTNDLAVRWASHNSVARRGDARPLYAAMRGGCTKMEAIGEFSTRADALAFEQDRILSLGTMAPSGFNLTSETYPHRRDRPSPFKRRSKPDPAIVPIQRAAFANAISIRDICLRAGVHPSTWASWARGNFPKTRKLRAMQAAVDEMISEDLTV